MKSFNSTDFCFFKQESDVLSKCKNYQCGQILCSNDKQTCDDSNMNLSNFSYPRFIQLKK